MIANPQDFHLKLTHVLILTCCSTKQQETRSDSRGNTKCRQAVGPARAGVHPREIVRRTGLSRNAIRKHLRADADEPSYCKRISPASSILTRSSSRASLRPRRADLGSGGEPSSRCMPNCRRSTIASFYQSGHSCLTASMWCCRCGRRASWSMPW